MKLDTLSSFALARMLNDCADGSAIQRQIQNELRSREVSKEYKDNKTAWLFSKDELKSTKKKWGKGE